MYEGDTIGKKFHIIGIPFDTAIYYGTFSEEIIDVNADGLKDAIERMKPRSISNESRNKTDTINQLCIYFNEGDSVFRYKTRSPFVLSGYYMGRYSILPYGNNGFCIRTEGRQLDWNKYYLYFQYDKFTDRFYLVKSLVQAEYENKTKKK
jgi:hypothetical protein